MVKRLLEDVTAIDMRVAQLYGDKGDGSRHSGTSSSKARSTVALSVRSKYDFVRVALMK